MAAVDCLYTTVQNLSASEKTFSFLPPHGRRMGAGEQLTVAGNLADRLASKTSNRGFKALERALDAGVLAIISTPTVFVYDDANDEAKGVAFVGPGLGAVDPCWAAP